MAQDGTSNAELLAKVKAKNTAASKVQVQKNGISPSDTYDKEESNARTEFDKKNPNFEKSYNKYTEAVVKSHNVALIGSDKAMKERDPKLLSELTSLRKDIDKAHNKSKVKNKK